MIACIMSFGSGAYYQADSTVIYVSNCSSDAYYFNRLQQEDDEERKRRHAEECRKRNMSYLWRPLLILHRLRFRVFAPFMRFMPCWSARRWRSVT